MWLGRRFFALGFAIPLLARLVAGRVAFRVSLVPAVGAALAGLSNLFEDALHWSGPPGSSGWSFWLFVLGTAVTVVGLAAFTVVVMITGRGSRRLLAAVPVATLIGMLLFEAGGGMLILAAWLAATAMAPGMARAYGSAGRAHLALARAGSSARLSLDR